MIDVLAIRVRDRLTNRTWVHSVWVPEAKQKALAYAEKLEKYHRDYAYVVAPARGELTRGHSLSPQRQRGVVLDGSRFELIES